MLVQKIRLGTLPLTTCLFNDREEGKGAGLFGDYLQEDTVAVTLIVLILPSKIDKSV